MKIAEINKPFSDGLEIIITQKGLKKTFVAKKAGYTFNNLCDMIGGRKIIKACDLKKLADVLGVKMDDIYCAGAKKGGTTKK